MHPLKTTAWSFMLSLCCLSSTMAEDPITVHYSDPHLAMLEKQLAITPAQRSRFEDIVVKYNDPANRAVVSNGNEGDAQANESRPQKHGRGGGGGMPGGGKTFGGGSRKISRQELDELATILTPGQIKRFQELHAKTPKGGRAKPDSAKPTSRPAPGLRQTE
jgi:Spy/CpxP family protein refolding chaperone